MRIKYIAIKTFCSKCNVTLCYTDTAALRVNKHLIKLSGVCKSRGCTPYN